jgi:hypothetical protein
MRNSKWGYLPSGVKDSPPLAPFWVDILVRRTDENTGTKPTGLRKTQREDTGAQCGYGPLKEGLGRCAEDQRNPVMSLRITRSILRILEMTQEKYKYHG